MQGRLQRDTRDRSSPELPLERESQAADGDKQTSRQQQRQQGGELVAGDTERGSHSKDSERSQVAARRRASVNPMQDLLHEALIDTGHVQHCALLRRKDGVVTAASLGHKPHKKTIEALENNFAMSAEIRRRSKEIEFEGSVYTCVRRDSLSLYAKQRSEVKEGIIVVATNLFIIYGTYGSHMHASVCVEAVERLGEYLRAKGK